MSLRTGVLAGTVAVAAMALAGCTADDEPSTAPPATSTPVVTPAVPSASAGNAAGAQPNGKRGVDVLITVAYANGHVAPPAGIVDVQVGDQVKITVTSDQQQNIDVQGQPDRSANVGPGQPASVSWTVLKPGDTQVSLREANTVLVTVHAA
ncbi:hypothetical protein [Amycolatopsis saalfeldensis]|uniref:Uncharacterized protein n=1 Tax=Amycolatopsis saalfeldensis TaxID=394193 RepID=A0A1H8YKE7_9PSEU|nr:hypothetical protein [Amycolatopsis saalfeldensis]SEP52645.1 hypothetical protein SAMN04489732_121116 [Amycolatopsis saalfeldensis]